MLRIAKLRFFFSQMGLHTFIRSRYMFFFKSALLLLLQFWWWVVVMMYMDVLTMLVRDMQIDVVSMRDVKLKYFAIGEISFFWWRILLFSISLLFFASLSSFLLVGYWNGVWRHTHSVGKRDVVPMREIYAFGGISCL